MGRAKGGHKEHILPDLKMKIFQMFLTFELKTEQLAHCFHL